jgi:elongation factor G
MSAFVFKTIADPFVGKMSFIKIISGKLNANTDYLNASTGNPEKIGKLYSLCGKKQTEILSVSAGDIVAAVKIAANTCDTICDASRPVRFEPVVFPKPCYGMAVSAKSQGDESKISSGIQRLLEEDKTLFTFRILSPANSILYGLGEQHIEAAVFQAEIKVRR